MSNLDGDIVLSLSFRSYNLSHSHNILLMTMYNNSSQKVRKSKYQIFLNWNNLAGFLYFVPNILCVVVGEMVSPV